MFSINICNKNIFISLSLSMCPKSNQRKCDYGTRAEITHYAGPIYVHNFCGTATAIE